MPEKQEKNKTEITGDEYGNNGHTSHGTSILGPVTIGVIVLIAIIAAFYAIIYFSMKSFNDKEQSNETMHTYTPGVKHLQGTDETDWLLDVDCGINHDAKAKNDNNQFATAPWLVSILIVGSLEDDELNLNKTRYLCTGTIISKKWILTATHCFSSLPNPKYCVNNCVVIAGSHSGEHGQYYFGSQHRIMQVIPFDKNFDYKQSNDIALIEVNPPFTFRKYSLHKKGAISRICLPDKGESYDFTSNSYELLLDENGAKIQSTYSNKLHLQLHPTREVALIADHDNCMSIDNSNLNIKLKNEKNWRNMIDEQATFCTTYDDPESDYCNYNNLGSSLIQKKHNRFVQIGVTSMSLTNNCVDEPLWYTVHTKVSHFRDWIRTITSV